MVATRSPRTRTSVAEVRQMQAEPHAVDLLRRAAPESDSVDTAVVVEAVEEAQCMRHHRVLKLRHLATLHGIGLRGGLDELPRAIAREEEPVVRAARVELLLHRAHTAAECRHQHRSGRLARRKSGMSHQTAWAQARRMHQELVDVNEQHGS
eukprot:scaffold5498_cov75-Phaeocystis_antarctica.AAC.2